MSAGTRKLPSSAIWLFAWLCRTADTSQPVGTEDLDDTALMTPSTFSVAAFRTASRAKRSPAELKRILVGEQAVLRARTARANLLPASISCSAMSGAQQKGPHVSTQQHVARHTWSATELQKIQRGKEAAQRMKASTTLRSSCRSLRDSCNWARSSVAAESSFADCRVLLKHDVHKIKQDLLRYDESVSCLESPRSLVSLDSSPQGKQLPLQLLRMQQASAMPAATAVVQDGNV